ncbi:MAG: c-type cytochrome [Sphingobacteriales bacterium]|nr:c-type cytochrome [Sphingobacteriales bacterium]
MKPRQLILLALFLGSANQLDAARNSSTLINEMALSAILVTLILIVIVSLMLLKTLNIMAAILLPASETSSVAEKGIEEPILEKKAKRSLWEKLLSLRPMYEEKDLLMEHEYDGIRELDNPTPAWFMWLFYITITFAFTYLLTYHVFKLGKLQNQEYVAEMKQASVDQEAFLAKSANRVDENSVKLTNDPTVLKDGAAIFKQNCTPCHGQHAEGIVGPNLTDEYWLHGGNINDIFKVIKYGVPEKGMISWEKQLTPKQIADVANYVKSLKDSHPANPKAPQGTKES